MNAQSEAEFREFYSTRWHRLLRTAYLLTGDHGRAEELLQSAMMRAYRHWRRIERTDAPEVYVRRIMVNLSITWWRRRRVPEVLTGSVPEYGGADGQAAHAQRDELAQAVRKLPPRMRAVLVLRYFEDLSEADTAHALGCSVGTVKSQSHAAIKHLRTLLGPEGTEPVSTLISRQPATGRSTP